MKLILTIVFLSIILFAKTYSKKDWEIYQGCKDRVYNNSYNNFDKKVCQLMLNDKDNLKNYGSEKMYNMWIKRIYYFDD